MVQLTYRHFSFRPSGPQQAIWFVKASHVPGMGAGGIVGAVDAVVGTGVVVVVLGLKVQVTFSSILFISTLHSSAAVFLSAVSLKLWQPV